MGNRWLRLRALLDSQWNVLVIISLVLALAGGWVTYGAYADPGTTTEERTVSSWSVTGDYNHSAPVTEENPVAPVGTTLSNRSIYLTEISPVVNGSFTFQYEASEGGNLNLTIEERAVVQSVAGQQGDTTVVWRQSRSLANRTANAVGPGSTVSVPFSINATEERSRTARIADALGNPPGDTQFAIITTVRFRGTVNNQAVDRTEQYVLPITFERGAYRLNATAATRQFETTESTVVEQQPSTLRALGGPMVLVLALGSACCLGIVSRYGRLTVSDPEREHLRFADDRDELAEWINGMTLPDDIYDRQQIRADSLAELVDFAIDTNNSVIEDSGYYVLHDGMLYTYEPPPIGPDRSHATLTEGTEESVSHDGEGDGETAASND